MPIIMLWLGVGDIPKTLVIFFGVSLPIIYHSFQGAKAVEEKMLWSGAAMGMSAAQRVIRILLPAACRNSVRAAAPGGAGRVDDDGHFGDDRATVRRGQKHPGSTRSTWDEYDLPSAQ